MVLEKARLKSLKNETMQAIELIFCVLHEMIDLLQLADDSDGVIGDIINESLSLIHDIADDEELSESDKEIILRKLMQEAKNNRYDDWSDWSFDLLQKCSELAYRDDLRKIVDDYLISLIKTDKADSWSNNYYAENINMIRYGMILRYNEPEKAGKFIQNNLKYSSFRKLAIDNAMKEKNYEEVIKLTKDGEKQDSNYIGLVHDWQKYRYTALKNMGNIDQQRAMAIDLILGGDYEYYMELKSTYDKTEWPSVYPRIISLIEESNKTYSKVYTLILIEEEEKRNL